MIDPNSHATLWPEFMFYFHSNRFFDLTRFIFYNGNLFFIFLLLFLASGFVFQPLVAQNFVTPEIVTELDENLNETSGLINLDGEIWTHNDKGGEAELYQIDITDGSILRTVTVQNATNIDWEDLAIDDAYVYIGDFGNNDGSRSDLKIYKISRYAIENYDEVYADIITFSYNDQTSFEPNYHNTNFDCEALISFQNDLYLFTKNWVDYQTNCYKLPNQSGDHLAQYHATFDVDCLITGAEINSGSNLLILIGYNLSGGSYTWLFDDFEGENFFDGDDTKLIWTSLTQIEGICKNNNNDLFISSEEFAGNIDPTLFSLDISEYLIQINYTAASQIIIYYLKNTIAIKSKSGEALTGETEIINMNGSIAGRYSFSNQTFFQFPVDLPTGAYLIVLKTTKEIFTQKIVIQ